MVDCLAGSNAKELCHLRLPAYPQLMVDAKADYPAACSTAE